MPARRRPPLPVPLWIARKRDGGALRDHEIRAVIEGAVSGAVPDYQMAALLMAIVWRGLTPRELDSWLQAMVSSGDRLRLGDVPGHKVDKHSTGGVGDKISLCLAPLVAACGVAVPMIAGRGLGHTGGTLDKLEAIPGFRTALSPPEIRRALRDAGFVICGQSERLVPADRLLYALRDATATVESIPLIASSILSKKIAEGADALVMDVKVGRGAFLPSRAAARALASTIVRLGRRAGLRTIALLTAMNQPLGREVGNAGEVREAIEVLAGGGPPDTRALTVRLGAEMLALGRAARTVADGERLITNALASGAGLDRFARGIEKQGGDPRVVDDPDRLPRARRRAVVRAPRAGVVTVVDARAIGQAATVLGAGRLRKEDRVDPSVGVTLHSKAGDAVRLGESLCTVWYNDRARWEAAQPLLERAYRLGDRALRSSPLLVEEIR